MVLTFNINYVASASFVSTFVILNAHQGITIPFCFVLCSSHFNHNHLCGCGFRNYPLCLAGPLFGKLLKVVYQLLIV